ncbi:lysis protein [Candidatus Fukatsuia endosymbiont of Tuberolachnus salignus]|uniref:lysis protein n=1 Tax=Candidatus Fukatsuia endosymbiont of Tuberolachnus salignus TaxID=3077957 RepID=UPI00313E4A02
MYGRLMILFITVLIGLLFYYHGRYLQQEKYYQGRMAEKDTTITTLNGELTTSRKNLIKLKKLQETVAATDKKYTEELAYAKANIDSLRVALAHGNKRLRLNASCDMSKTTTATGVDDAPRARLTDASQWDYLNLRTNIAIATTQIAGLQSYINNLCLAKSPPKN